MDNQELYLADPEDLKFPVVSLSLQKRRDFLKQRLMKTSSLWYSLRSRSSNLVDVLNEVGNAVGVGKELTDKFFENSPFGILQEEGLGDYDSYFGYLAPSDVSRYQQLLASVPGSVTHDFENRNDDGFSRRVLYVLRSSLAEAAKRGCAIAANHC